MISRARLEHKVRCRKAVLRHRNSELQQQKPVLEYHALNASWTFRKRQIRVAEVTDGTLLENCIDNESTVHYFRGPVPAILRIRAAQSDVLSNLYLDSGRGHRFGTRTRGVRSGVRNPARSGDDGRLRGACAGPGGVAALSSKV